MHRYKGTVFVHRFQLVTLETFQAVKLEAPKGGLGRAQLAGAEAGCWALEDGSGKEGEWGGAGRHHRPYSCHRQSATHKTGPL